jgi:S1-C subfamily serine protease
MREDSDHYSFFRRNIPVLMFHTGKHGDYHRPSDDVEKLNLEGIRRIARLMVDVTMDLADKDETPAWREASRREGITEKSRDAFERPLVVGGSRFGVKWKPATAGEEGILVTYVEAGTAAAKAGIRTGDRILTFAGRKIDGDREFQRAVWRQAGPAVMSVVSSGAAQPHDVTITLDGSPIRFGVTWLEDEAEPASVVVKGVHPFSPAAEAGLAAGDRIYGVNGKTFAAGDQFEAMLDAAKGETTLLVERSGVVTTRTLDVQ